MLFFVSFVNKMVAQEIAFKTQKSDIFKDEYKDSQIVLSEEDGSGGVLMVRSYRGKGISPNSGFYLEHYNVNLKLVKEFDLETKQLNSQKYQVTLGVYKNNNVIRIIEMYYDIHEKSYICIANSISKNDFKVEKKELFRLTREEIKQYGSFSLANLSFEKNDKKLASETNGYFSETSNGVSILAKNNKLAIAIDFMSSNNTETLKVLLFDDHLNKKMERIYKKQIKDSEFVFQNIDLSSDENTVYLLSKSFSKDTKKKEQGGKYQFEITKFAADKEESKMFDINDHFIGSLKSIFINNKLVCIGFYSDQNDDRFKGISYFELDPNNLNLRFAKYSPFTEQFILDKYGKIKDKELKDLNFKNILICPNNEIILNAEESYATSGGGGVGIGVGGVGFGGMNMGGTGFGGMTMGGFNVGGVRGGLYFGGIYGKSFNHLDDIVSIKINSEGNLIWARNINKRQSDNSSFSLASYTSVISNNNDVFFFINAKEKIKELSNNRIEFKGDGNLYLIRINEKGEFDYQNILDEEENELPFMVSNGIKSGNSVFFLGRKGSKKQLLKVSL